MLKNIILIIGLLLGSLTAAQAQQTVRPCTTQTNNLDCLPVSAANPLPVTGSSGGGAVFTPNGSYATLTATGSSARVALPTGTVVVAYNTGTSAVSCVLGNGSVTATTNQDQIVAGGFFSYTVGANADLACIDQTGSASNVVVLSGGSGIASGAGGGGVSGSLGNNADGVVPVTTGLLGTDAYNYVYNGTGWDRASGLTTGTFGTPSSSVLSVQNNDPCSYASKSSVAINITSATTTSLVAVSGSTTVYVCGFSLTISQVITTANTILFEYGTSTNCTGTNALTGTYGTGGVTAGAPLVIAIGNAGQTIFKSAASAGICAVTTIGATAAYEGVMTYVQQ